MPLIGDLSRPENCAELAQRRRIVAKISQAGGCPYCIHRGAEGWGRAVCTTTGRAFPLCLHDKSKPAFTLDEAKLKESMR